jgi:hypothetical protein
VHGTFFTKQVFIGIRMMIHPKMIAWMVLSGLVKVPILLNDATRPTPCGCGPRMKKFLFGARLVVTGKQRRKRQRSHAPIANGRWTKSRTKVLIGRCGHSQSNRIDAVNANGACG